MERVEVFFFHRRHFRLRQPVSVVNERVNPAISAVIDEKVAHP